MDIYPLKKKPRAFVCLGLYYLQEIILLYYFISTSFCVITDPEASAFTKYMPLEILDASQVNVCVLASICPLASVATTWPMIL